MLEILSFITGRKIVYLLHFDSEVTRTIEGIQYKRFSNNKTCYVHFFTKIGLVIMKEDGSTIGCPYIIKWKY